MSNKLLYICTSLILTTLFYYNRPAEKTQQDKDAARYLFNYIQSPSSVPFLTAMTEFSALNGYAISQFRLGGYYLDGIEGKAQDYIQAKYWYKKAAEQNNLQAQSQLGWMYLQGLGMSADLKRALYWYKKSANQGYVHAQYILGVIYIRGEGIPVNYTEARVWLEKAASQNHEHAIKMLAALPAL